MDTPVLRETFPAWNIRSSASGRSVMATRRDRRALSGHELWAGLAMTIIKDSVEELADALADQRTIESAL